MNLFKLSIKNLLSRPWWSGLSLLLLILGVGMIDFMGHVEDQVSKKVTQHTTGIDMVVGAKGSPIQLILSSVLHIDAPTGNIPFSSLEKLRKNRLVDKAIPLSFGDNYRGNRIVGTEQEFMTFYGLTLQDGKQWEAAMDVVLGAAVARSTGLGLGDEFTGSHGLQEGGHAHDDHAYKVVGILENSETVADNLILTAQESVWNIHAHETPSSAAADEHDHDDQEDHHHEKDHGGEHHEEDHHEEEHHEEEHEITSILVTFRNPMGVIQLPRQVNAIDHLQAAVPAIEMNRLMTLLGVGVDTLEVVSAVIMLIGGASIFITLLATMQERKYELAFMRAYGASRGQLAFLVIGEAATLSFVGGVIGIVLARAGMMVMGNALEESYHYGINAFDVSWNDVKIILGVLALGIMAAIIPAWQAFRLNISKTLAHA
ncbi:ABC transporter permease [Echinicola vietnamensis]|uniref:ABC-type transport system, involved in lipoprotein release, permease component n=1 Tax=Echinicola vietnamensis (strain DSM 17526 / LMG 23754 / KMM 6221) TaxID=926556 RepID=L0G262_ECHVK|nr:ABC transporter permease [Echinicola vietnamensis]AGA78945.1 ABC-type transport system, involved in lipoprotein release, permease component [Echinicola vietnamensis DSM 17526]